MINKAKTEYKICNQCGRHYVTTCVCVVEDDIKNPSHYTWIPGIECKDVVKHFDWARGNAIKYIWRSDHKGNFIKDINKAIECLEIAKDHYTNKGDVK
jgi:hypothetical protein